MKSSSRLNHGIIVTISIILGLCPLQAAEKASSSATPPPIASAQPSQKPLVVKEETETKGVEKELARSERSYLLHPSLTGQVGIFRVQSAENLPKGSLTFGIGGEFYSGGEGPTLSGTKQSLSTIAESLFVGYSPDDKWTLALQRRNSSTTFGPAGTAPQLISSLGDFVFSGHYSIEVLPILKIAPVADITVASNFNNLAPSGSTISAGFGAAATIGIGRSLGAPLTLHANVLYHMPQISDVGPATLAPETFFRFSRFHTISTAIGADWTLGDFIPFAELSSTTHLYSGLSLWDPSVMTIGSRWTPLENKSLAVLLGVDIGLSRGVVAGTPYSPPFQVIGMLSYTLGLLSTERLHYYATPGVRVVNRKYVISENIRFKVGKAELESESHPILDQIAQVTKSNSVKKLLIVGHTDSSHNEDYNLKLSLDRAATVKAYLVRQGIEEDTMVTQGYGKRKPKASNLTEEGRTLNRRVEFFILE